MNSGIYKIVCDVTSKIYIGSSKNLNKRWLRHLCDLRNNKHINIHLQRAFYLYGINAFTFEIIEYCDSDLLLREQYYLDLLQPYNNGYNIGKQSSGGDNITNNPKREEIILKMKKSLNRFYDNMTDVERIELYGNRCGDKNPNYGNRWTDDERKEMSDKKKGKCPVNKGKTNVELLGVDKAGEISKVLSKIASERIGDKNPFWNKKHTDASKEKISKSRIGKYSGNQNIFKALDASLKELYLILSISTSIPVVTIRWRCISPNAKFSNYILI